MRTIITIGICVFLGVVLGILLARAHFGGKIAEIAKQREEMVRENERLNAELQFAAERLRYMETDYASLQKQLDALVSSRPMTSSPAGQGMQSAATDLAVAEGQLDGDVSSPNNQTSDTGAVQGSVQRAASDVEVRIEQDRVRVQDFIQTQIETSPDPAEQARLSRLQEDMEQVRDLFTQLRESQSAEERQNIIRQVARIRAEMRDIVLEQRASLVRQTLEQAGISDAAQQQHLISALEELQNSPYYTDQMLIWGMAPQPRQE